MIEIELRTQGYPETRRVLDDQRRRKELDEICEIAESEEEINRRNRFNDWKNKVLENCKSKIDIEGESTNVRAHQNYLLISNSRFDALLGKSLTLIRLYHNCMSVILKQ